MYLLVWLLPNVAHDFISVMPVVFLFLIVVCMAFNALMGVHWSSGVIVLLLISV